MRFWPGVNGSGNRFCLQSVNLSSCNTRSSTASLEWDLGGVQSWSGSDDDDDMMMMMMAMTIPNTRGSALEL